MTDERCMSCRFFEREGDMVGDVDKGLCKRYPPMAGYDPGTVSVVTCWPLVDWTDRCGEWVAE